MVPKFDVTKIIPPIKYIAVTTRLGLIPRRMGKKSIKSLLI